MASLFCLIFFVFCRSFLPVFFVFFCLAPSSSAWSLFETSPIAVVAMFGKPTNIPNPEDYWLFGEKTFRIFLCLVTFTCIVKMTSIFFQAVGKPVQAVVSSMVRDILCFIPLIIIFPLTIGGVESILYAAPVADAIAMVIATVLTILFMRSIKANKEDKLPPLDEVKENAHNAK